MNLFYSILKNSARLVIKHPRLIIPKLIEAFFLSIAILALVGVFNAVFIEHANPFDYIDIVIFWGIYLVIIWLLHVLTNGTYPQMAESLYLKNKISLMEAYQKAGRKALILIPSVLIEYVIIIIIAVIISVPVAWFWITKNIELFYIGLFLLAIAIFILAVFFYLLYPVAILEKKGIVNIIARTITLSRSNLKDVSKAMAITFLTSLISMVAALGIERYTTEELIAFQGVAILLFVISRFINTLVATYQTVLNQSFYLEYERKLVLE